VPADTFPAPQKHDILLRSPRDGNGYFPQVIGNDLSSARPVLPVPFVGNVTSITKI
jgi:hypothetical protein